MKIKWAPINVPLRRRLQTLSTAFYIIFLFTALLGSYFLMATILLFYPFYWRLGALLYIAYIYYDHTFNYSAASGIGLKFLRSNFISKLFREYYPIELVKTCELRPDRNYMLCIFPHGFPGSGSFANICFDIQLWLENFPKIRPKVATLNINLCAPFLREIFRFSGFVSVDKQSLIQQLVSSNDPNDPVNRDGFTSNSIGLSIGGTDEVLYSRPRNYVVILKKRKGFIKIALETGCPLVPAFSFGEAEGYNQVVYQPNSLIKKIQNFMKKLLGLPIPVVILGRGFFQYSFGLLPYRKRIVQVVGAPIEVTKSISPTEEEVEQLHRKFTESLIDLFETHKSKYLENSNELKLKII